MSYTSPIIDNATTTAVAEIITLFGMVPDGVFKTRDDGLGGLIIPKVRIVPLPTTYANNAAAVSGGLVAGDLYRTGADPDVLCIVH